MEAIIQVNRLTKTYAKHSRGVIKLDMTVHKEISMVSLVQMVQANPTTIRTILGYIQPTEGNASILGLDIAYDNVEILKRVGYMPVEAMFFGNMKVKDIIKYAASLRKIDCSEEVNPLCQLFEVDVTNVLMNFLLEIERKSV